MATNKRAQLSANTIQRLQGRALPHRDPVVSQLAEPKEENPRSGRRLRVSPRAPSRVGKAALTVWTSEQRRRALKAYAAQNGLSIEELVLEGIDDLMVKRRIREDPPE